MARKSSASRSKLNPGIATALGAGGALLLLLIGFGLYAMQVGLRSRPGGDLYAETEFKKKHKAGEVVTLVLRNAAGDVDDVDDFLTEKIKLACAYWKLSGFLSQQDRSLDTVLEYRGSDTFHLYMAPFPDIDRIKQFCRFGTVANVDSATRRVLVDLSLPDPVRGEEVDELWRAHGRQYVVRVLIRKPVNHTVEVFPRMRDVFDRLDQKVHLARERSNGDIEFFVTKVQDVTAFSQRIPFGKVMSVDTDRRLVEITADMKAEVLEKPLPDPSPEYLARIIPQHRLPPHLAGAFPGSGKNVVVTSNSGSSFNPSSPIPSGIATKRPSGFGTRSPGTTGTTITDVSKPSGSTTDSKTGSDAGRPTGTGGLASNTPTGSSNSKTPKEDEPEFVGIARELRSRTSFKKEGILDDLMTRTVNEAYRKTIGDALADTLDDEHFLMKKHLKAMTRWNCDATVRAIVNYAKKNVWASRYKIEIMSALTELKDPEGAEFMASLLETRDASEADIYLKRLGPIAEDPVLKYAENPGENTRKLVYEILAVVGGEKSLTKLRAVAAKERTTFMKDLAKKTIDEIRARLASK